MKQIGVLFLHGLSFADQVDIVNKHFEKQIRKEFEGSDLKVVVKYVNYARLHEDRQLKMCKRLKYSWLDWKTILRMLPLRVLNMGLSFWGSESVRQDMFHHVIETVNELGQEMIQDSSQSSDDDDISFVLVGFSMGATLGVEFLTNYLQSECQDGFTLEGRLLLQQFKLLITLGCAVNWHHPIRPFHRKVQIPWTNIHYASDILSSGISVQGEEVAHVKDVEFGFMPDMNEITQYTKKLKSMSVFSVIQVLFGLFKSLVTFLLIFIGRITPFSHFMYFYDDDVYQTMASEIKENMDFNEKVPMLRSPVSPWDKDEEAVSIEKVYTRTIISDSTAKEQRFVFVYVHGMSTASQIDSEIEQVKIGLSSSMEQLAKASKKNITFDLHLLRYDLLMSKDNEIRTKGLDPVSSIYSYGRHQILCRFPIALSYWAEDYVRTKIHDGFQKALNSLSDEYRNTSGIVMIIAYTTGALVSALALGKLQDELNIPTAADIFGKGSGLKLKYFLSIANPLPWFGASHPTPLPSWSSEANSEGWINILYKNDVHAVPLKECDEYLARHVRKDIILKCSSSKGIMHFRLLNEILSCWTGYYLKEAELWNLLIELCKDITCKSK